jgi:hypothetical protein
MKPSIRASWKFRGNIHKLIMLITNRDPVLSYFRLEKRGYERVLFHILRSHLRNLLGLRIGTPFKIPRINLYLLCYRTSLGRQTSGYLDTRTDNE